MATGSWPTLADVASRTSANGEQLVIAELLSQSVAIYKDLPIIESSEMGGHEFSYRESIPSGAWRQANQGVPYGKSTTGKSRVDLGTLEEFSQVDRLVAEMSGDVDTFREGEDVAVIEGMGQTVEETVWYGNTAVNPAQFNGLSTFYNTVSATTQNSANVIDGGGVGNSNLSIWLLGLGPRRIFGLYPRSTKAGLSVEDLSMTMSGYDSLGNPFRAYTTWFRHMLGICPQDWRFGARYANVDVTSAGLAGPNAPDLWATFRQMMLLMPTMTSDTSGITESDAPSDSMTGIRFGFYTNRTGRHYMDVQGMRDRNVLLTINDAAGKPQDMVNGVPVKVSDQLLVNESRVV